MGGRVGSKKYYAPDGSEYDSREEYLYLQKIVLEYLIVSPSFLHVGI